MIGGDAQIIKALCGGNDGIFGIVDGIIVRECGKVLLNFGADDPNGMVGFEMQPLAYEGGDVRGNVVFGVIEKVARWIGVVAGR